MKRKAHIILLVLLLLSIDIDYFTGGMQNEKLPV